MACTLRELHLRDGFFFLRTFNHPPKWRAAVNRSLDVIILAILTSYTLKMIVERSEKFG